MYTLNKKSSEIFFSLVDGLDEDNSAKKIDNSQGTFMPVSVEFLYELPAGKFYSIAHRYEQNGDLMSDPDMVFLVQQTPEGPIVRPSEFTQHGIAGGYYRYLELNDDGTLRGFYRRKTENACRFVSMWFENIRQQQNIEKMVVLPTGRKNRPEHEEALCCR